MDSTEVGELWQALMHLAVHVGIMDAAFESDEYEAARSGWEARKGEITDWANHQIEEIQDFAESFDRE